MARDVAGWRFPSDNELQRAAVDAGRWRADQPAVEQLLAKPAVLRDVRQHLLLFSCPHCTTITEIQTTDAIRLCGGHATVDDVGALLGHDDCHCDLVLVVPC